MAYTPELSQRSSSMLRRIAWAIGMPMTKALEEIIEHVIKHIRKDEVCRRCRDKSFCSGCGFNNNRYIEGG
ncbi:MAG TPA: hypothetical protein PLL96_10395 [Syntrophorhabdaceae bacterium]|nr:hypothetical protein [Syntrophorhabdaceae bacterium]HRR72730.1 hypothetical protein [Syntrophorhabdaceae bacterium]HRV23499.1 hypothetical protein [Syntrophorhabdaceae bacterium]